MDIYIFHKKEKQIIQKWWIYDNGKSTFKRFGLVNLHQDYKIVKKVLLGQRWIFMMSDLLLFISLYMEVSVLWLKIKKFYLTTGKTAAF